MKNIRIYHPNKYDNENYQKIDENIYKTTYTPSGTYDELHDQELINTLKGLKNWEKTKSWEYSIQYESKTYFIDAKNYEAGNLDSIFAPSPPKEVYVTSLVFESEPNLGENEPEDKIISQYPLEDIEDKFLCFCMDFYPEENSSDKKNSYIEFASTKIENIRNLLTIVGKHVYNKENNGYIVLVIE